MSQSPPQLKCSPYHLVNILLSSSLHPYYDSQYGICGQNVHCWIGDKEFLIGPLKNHAFFMTFKNIHITGVRVIVERV